VNPPYAAVSASWATWVTAQTCPIERSFFLSAGVVSGENIKKSETGESPRDSGWLAAS